MIFRNLLFCLIQSLLLFFCLLPTIKHFFHVLLRKVVAVFAKGHWLSVRFSQFPICCMVLLQCQLRVFEYSVFGGCPFVCHLGSVLPSHCFFLNTEWTPLTGNLSEGAMLQFSSTNDNCNIVLRNPASFRWNRKWWLFHFCCIFNRCCLTYFFFV